MRQLERAYDVIGVGGQGEIARRPTNPPRGVPGERLVLEQLAAEFDFRRLGWLGRFRFRRLRACFGYALAATIRSPLGGDFSFAFSCHSCRLLTLPVRLRSAMTASHAALAADIVVVYGTRCTSAARRMA